MTKRKANKSSIFNPVEDKDSNQIILKDYRMAGVYCYKNVLEIQMIIGQERFLSRLEKVLQFPRSQNLGSETNLIEQLFAKCLK